LCIACGQAAFRPYLSQLIKCQNCELVTAAIIPTEEELNMLYQQEYFFGKEYSDYKADRQALEYNFKKRIQHLGPFISPSTRLVEVGCAYGYFLNLIKNKVKHHQGYDVSTDGVEFALNELKVNASNQNFLTAKIKKQSVDLVCMWDVIEHLADPDSFLEKIHEILTPGGHLAFTTGDISGLVPKLRGEKWRMIHPPTHLYYFSPKTAELLLNRQGFKVVSVRHPSVYRNIGSVVNQLKYNRLAKRANVGIFGVADGVSRKTGIGNLNFPLNTFDIMEVVAVKE